MRNFWVFPKGPAIWSPGKLLKVKYLWHYCLRKLNWWTELEKIKFMGGIVKQSLELLLEPQRNAPLRVFHEFMDFSEKTVHFWRFFWSSCQLFARVSIMSGLFATLSRCTYNSTSSIHKTIMIFPHYHIQTLPIHYPHHLSTTATYPKPSHLTQ